MPQPCNTPGVMFGIERFLVLRSVCNMYGYCGLHSEANLPSHVLRLRKGEWCFAKTASHLFVVVVVVVVVALVGCAD